MCKISSLSTQLDSDEEVNSLLTKTFRYPPQNCSTVGLSLCPLQARNRPNKLSADLDSIYESEEIPVFLYLHNQHRAL